MTKGAWWMLPALPTLLLALLLAAPPAGVYGQEGSAAATATTLALKEKLHSIYATQTAAAAPAEATGTAAPATSSPAARQPAATQRATPTPAATATLQATPTPRPTQRVKPTLQPLAVVNVSGMYVSDVYPAASAPGLVLLMSLYPNNNAELVSYYFSNPPITEQGTWESSGDSVTVSLTGNAEQTYDQPNVETFTVGDGSLTSGGFVFHKQNTIKPEQLDAATNPAPTKAGPTTAEADDNLKVLVTEVYPAGDASGMVMLMALFGNGNMEQLSIYLGKDAILEVGTWTEDARTFETTLTGQLDSQYETSVTASYTRDGNGLTDGTFSFHPLQVITPADIEAMMKAAMTVYQSDTLPAADSPGRVITLSLYKEDSRAEMTTDFLNDTPPFVDLGTWESTEEGQLTVTLTHSADQGEYITPIVIGFDDVDGTLTAVDYDKSLFGSEGLTLHAVQ